MTAVLEGTAASKIAAFAGKAHAADADVLARSHPSETTRLALLARLDDHDALPSSVHAHRAAVTYEAVAVCRTVRSVVRPRRTPSFCSTTAF
jgi:hypothetical protein